MIKEGKDASGYTLIPQSDGRRCGLCKFFEPSVRECLLVSGPINPNASCDNFEREGQIHNLVRPLKDGQRISTSNR